MKTRNIFPIILVTLLIVIALQYTIALPAGANITYNVSETKSSSPAEYLNTSGGSFTTILLYGETQNIKWKAYASNVSGSITLDDAANYSIYQWIVTDYTGEVFV